MSDPLFFEDFRNRIRNSEAPVNLSPQLGLIKKQEDYFGRAFRYSGILHLSLLLFTFVTPLVLNFLGIRDSYEDKFKNKEFRNAIRVDMVGLPTLTVEELQKVDPTLEIGRVNPPKAEESREKVAVKAPSPSETAMKLTQEKEERAKLELSKKEAMEKAKREAADNERKRLEDLRASLRVEDRRRQLMQELKGPVKEGEGRIPLQGNILSEGYSVTGDVASDMDVYQGHLKAHLRKTWNLPAWMQASNLSARVLVKLAPNGRILSQEFLRVSGNPEFDRYVAEALKNAEPFPQPPPSLQRTVMEQGVEWGFPQ
jgi:TonB family protein